MTQSEEKPCLRLSLSMVALLIVHKKTDATTILHTPAAAALPTELERQLLPSLASHLLLLHVSVHGGAAAPAAQQQPVQPAPL